MKQIFLFLIVLLFGASCERVAPNYAGVLMQNWGKAGKDDFSLVKGRVQTAFQPGSELFQVPLWEQRAQFEGDMHFMDADRAEYTAKPSYSYTAVESRAVDLVFINKHLGNGEDFMQELENNILEPIIYDISKDICRSWTTDQLTAQRGNLKFERSVYPIIDSIFAAKGLKLNTFTLQLQPSDKVREKIDSRNEINTNISVLDQQIQEQIKRNELAKLRSEENSIMTKGLTNEVLVNKFIEKWDGHSALYGISPTLLKSLDIK